MNVEIICGALNPVSETTERSLPPGAWNVPPTRLRLGEQDVHIWRATLDLPGRSVRELAETLSIDESMKAERFRFERDRNRFIAARGILRLILGGYLGIKPSTLQFYYEKNGKPRLKNAFSNTDIRFNLSHSEGLALYVFTCGHEVGVDIEYIREMPEMDLIAEQAFSERDRAPWGALPESEKRERFFNLWVRKEALLKATGDGLSYPPDAFDVSADPGKTLAFSGTSGTTNESSRWTIGEVSPAEGFAGSFVVEGSNREVQYWQWPG
ncbi:MAG TPA: 4'-phosphopantetheinyl transferase superfamily protein [Syntrophales bacterium]|nr:4'-phosphopantetheinyl transferase superfamily protein [Syntrophales bacterium]HPI56348.1 4'-phosphopantetheinyl transferase superfamily protein [Syntrophales bacterium]HPN24264.1 4'-phosphopantetheinyl transferase superfamily protein [Syntrophales bacterium]HQM28617.1 4'-phosphopantetheinyl transferase superfamily protein [Syntrophales bacterium]